MTTTMTPDSQNLEWKRSWRDEYLKWICGFANAQGGVLEIGKDDGGEVVGVTGVLSLVEEIPNKVRSRLLSRGNDRGLGARDPPYRGTLSGGREPRADVDPGAGRRPVSALSVFRGVQGCRPGGSPGRRRATGPRRCRRYTRNYT